MVVELTKLVRDRRRQPRLPARAAIDDTAFGRKCEGTPLAKRCSGAGTLLSHRVSRRPEPSPGGLGLASAGDPLDRRELHKKIIPRPDPLCNSQGGTYA